MKDLNDIGNKSPNRQNYYASSHQDQDNQLLASPTQTSANNIGAATQQRLFSDQFQLSPSTQSNLQSTVNNKHKNLLRPINSVLSDTTTNTDFIMSNNNKKEQNNYTSDHEYYPNQKLIGKSFDNNEETLASEDNEKEQLISDTTTFMFLKLKPSIHKFHILAYYLMVFTILLVVQFIIGFLIFILGNPNYYNLPDDQVGQVSGDCGFYAEILVIIFDLVLGVIFDTVGKKIPTVIGFLVAGLSIILTPEFTQVYPSFLIMRIFMSLGIIPGVNTPLLPDYVNEKSLGLANAYQNVTGAIAIIFASTGLIEISKREDIKWIFVGIGTYTMVVGLVLFFGIKDVNKQKKGKIVEGKSKITAGQQISNTIMEFINSFKQDICFTIAFWGSFCCKLSALTCSLFGQLLIIANQKESGDPDYKANAKAKIQFLFLIGNILQVPICLAFGFYSDKTKVWYLLALNIGLSLGFLILMLCYLNENSAVMFTGFIGLYLFHYIVYMLSLTLLSKIVKKESSGTMFGAFSLVGSVGVLLINKLGGYLFDNVGHKWPFIITLISFAIFFVLVLIFGLLKKLKV
eukprot:403334683